MEILLITTPLVMQIVENIAFSRHALMVSENKGLREGMLLMYREDYIP